MNSTKDTFSVFFKKEKKELYFNNIKAIMNLSVFYMIALILFSLAGLYMFSQTPERLIPLLITYATMFMLMVVIYFFAKYIEKNNIIDIKLSIFMTYLTMILSMVFILIISVFIARPTIRASYFLVFNILLPSLFILRKREIILSELISALVFIILSFFLRNEVFKTDLYLSVGSLIIGIPYNLMIYNVRMNDAYTKKNYLDKAYLDALSGLPNRRAFNSKLESVYSKFDHDSIVMAIIDIDNFKNINDTKGHAYGDYAIKEIGSVLKKFAEEYQFFISRIGGDEFVLIGLNLQVIRLTKTLDELLNAVRGLELKDSEQIKLSIGAFYSNTPYKYTSEEFFIKADEALYYVKENNKGEIKLIIDE